MGSSVGNIIRQIAPIAIGVLTGNPWLGAAAGGIGGALGGGGLKGALMGGLSGYGGASLGGGLASGLSGAGGLSGLASTASNAVKGFFSNPLGSLSSGLSSAGTKLSSLLTGGGTAAGAAGTGAKALAAGGALASGGGASAFGGNALSNVLSGLGSTYAIGDAENSLVDSQKTALKGLAPYTANGKAAAGKLADMLGLSGNVGVAGYGSLSKGFTPGDLQNDPGYQFNLTQGNKALDNRLAATGGLDSGSAIKAGQQFGQGLADTTYNNAFQRDLATKNMIFNNLSGVNNSGMAAQGQAGDYMTNIGEAKAGGTIGQSNALTQALSGLLTGNGARRIIGYGMDGQPIYA